LTSDDLLRGLKLQIGQKTDRNSLHAMCEELQGLKAFYSLSCNAIADGNQLWLEVAVKGAPFPPLIFDNFVWTTRMALVARLKQEVPLFTPGIPYDSALNPDIVRVLNRIVAEHGIKGGVEHSQFWIDRGMNVFVVNGISAPVVSCEIVGENAPPPAEIRAWSHVDDGWNLSLAELNWKLDFALRDLYYSRGYLHPIVQESQIRYLGQRDGRYPVKVIMRISSGPQYIFRSIRFEGRARAHAGQLLSAWRLKPGEAYNDSYTSEFESKMLDEPWAQKDATSSFTSSSCVTINESERSVFLTITVGLPKQEPANGQITNCAEMHQWFSYPGNYVEPASGAN
jgi:hypothetical protein